MVKFIHRRAADLLQREALCTGHPPMIHRRTPHLQQSSGIPVHTHLDEHIITQGRALRLTSIHL